MQNEKLEFRITVLHNILGFVLYGPFIALTYWLYLTDGTAMFREYHSLLILAGLLVFDRIYGIFVWPYFFIWALRQPVDAQLLRFKLKAPLPFYPQRKWYFNWIPFIDRYENAIAEISLRLRLPMVAPGLEMPQPGERIVAKKGWLNFFAYGFGAIGLLGVAVFFFSVSAEASTFLLWATILLLASIRTLFKALDVVQSPKQLSVGPEGITIDERAFAWQDIEHIGLDWGNGWGRINDDMLLVTTKSGALHRINIEYFDASWRYLYSFAVYYNGLAKGKGEAAA